MITKEAIEAARSAIRYLNGPDTPWSDEQVSAVITAALAAMPAQGVRVKVKEWEDKPGLSFAKTSIGTYFIRERHGYWKLELDDAVITASDKAIVFPSLQAAKAAAQADYERRIMAALETDAEPAQNYNCPCAHPSQCDSSCLTPARIMSAIEPAGVGVDTPPPSSHLMVEERSRMQLPSGYLNSFETVIGALEKGGEQAQAAGHIAHGACLLHAAVELRHVWTERKERDSITQAEDLYEIAEALNCECDVQAIIRAIADLKSKVSEYRREVAATIREGISAVADARQPPSPQPRASAPAALTKEQTTDPQRNNYVGRYDGID